MASGLTIRIPPYYGYVVGEALILTPLLAWFQGFFTMRMRKGAEVPYPNAYATPQQVKDNPLAHRFNASQRAHHQLLENMSQTVAQMLFVGLWYPKATAVVGAVWLLGRLIYWHGYVYTPQVFNRTRGNFFWFSQMALMGMAGSIALKLL